MCSVARKPLGRIFVSSSRCIFENLAFEENLLITRYKENATDDVMLIWSNDPTVVIGRYQNPWLEANLPLLKKNGISLARRHSGGGTVYHDRGNVNVSLFTTQKDHCRKRNLVFLADQLNEQFGLRMSPTSRDDLELPGNRKCSGTAARISRGQAYHHLTLLVNVDLDLLRNTLRSPHQALISNTSASRSVRAPAVGFLAQDAPDIDKEKVIETLIEAYTQQFEVTQVSGLASPLEIPEVAEIHHRLTSWEWTFGTTPKFEFQSPGKQSLVIEKGVVTGDPDGTLIGQRFLPS